jgi:hypothetical protein
MQVKTPVKKTAENKQQYRSPEKTYNKGRECPNPSQKHPCECNDYV